MLALLLVACGQREAPLAGAEASTPRAGGELVFAFDGTAASRFGLDPQKASFAPHQRVIRSLYDNLVVALPGHQFGPWLASKWDISPDGRSYTFHLRPGVTFHDGTPLDAEAVKFNFDRIRDPKNLLGAVSDIGSLQSATVVDPLTVRLDFKDPYWPLLANLSKSTMGIVSPTAARKSGEDFPLNPVGSGPFRYVSQQPGTEIVLERNPDYRWAPAGAAHEGPAWIERLTFKNVPEEATRVAVLQNGQAGAADIIPSQNVATFKSSDQFQLTQGELLNHNYALYLNLRRTPWTDVRVREAFKLSLDLDAAVRTVHLGVMQRAWSVLSPSLPGYDRTLEGSWTSDPVRAAALLEELGWKKGEDGVRAKDGKRLTVTFLDSQGNREKRLDLLTVLRRQAKAAGFDLRIESQPGGSYLGKVTAGDYDLIGGSLFDADPDVLRRIYTPTFRISSGYTQVDDPVLNRLLDAGYREADPTAHAAIYAQVQQRIDREVYAIPTYVMQYSIATTRKVHGVKIDPHGFPVLHDTWVTP